MARWIVLAMPGRRLAGHTQAVWARSYPASRQPQELMDDETADRNANSARASSSLRRPPCVTASLLISIFNRAERCQSVLTMRTAQAAWWDTELGTLPRKCRVPCIPLLPTTTRSAATASATSRMALTASLCTA